MSLDVVITSENKGSNPGGRAIILDSRAVDAHASGPVYLKYCTGSKVYGGHLVSQHQPFYEAMFMEMAKVLGLAVPGYFVLLNEKEDVSFSYSPEEGENPKRLNQANKNFFVSQMVDHPIVQNGSLVSQLMDGEKIYRDVLNLGDISGRPNNYTLVTPEDGTNPYMLYIDLGCALADAHNGVLSIRNGLSKRLERFTAKDLRVVKSRLSKVNLSVNHGSGYVNLAHLGEKVPRICAVNVLDAANPARLRRVPLTKILSEGELLDFERIYFLSNQNFSSKYKKDPKIKIAR